MATTRGILLAGGIGTRLYPMTAAVSKQLLPVYDKPLVYYPLCTLMQAGVSDVLVISTPEHLALYQQLLGDGTRFGISIHYAIQPEPRGIAEALIIAEDALGSGPVVFILGDNLFHGEGTLFRLAVDANPGATIFGYPVHDPQRYGVVELDGKGAVVSIQEKPAKPPGNLAIPGLYIYDGQAAAFARTLTQSSRGELEITDVHKRYMEQGTLIVRRMERGMAWLDAGTPESLLEAGTFIHAIEQRQGLKVGCPEEVALHLGYLDVDAFARSVAQLPVSAYRTYCESLLSQ